MPLYEEVAKSVASGTFPKPDPVVIKEITGRVDLPYITYVDLKVIGPILASPDSKDTWDKLICALRNVPVQGSTILWEAWWKKSPRHDRYTELWKQLDLLPLQLPTTTKEPVKLNGFQVVTVVIEEMQREHADKSQFNSDTEAKVLQNHNFHNALSFLQDRLFRRLAKEGAL
jgi:hypothetical protein